MGKQEDFEDAVFEFFAQSEFLDDDNAARLVITRQGQEIEVGAVFPIVYCEVNFIVCPRLDVNDIFIAVTDGPENDVVLLLERLTEFVKEDDLDWGTAIRLPIEYFNQFGIYGLYFNRLSYKELFEQFDDYFDYHGKQYNLKTVTFLSEKETDCFFDCEYRFYDMVESKDPVKFSQLDDS